LYIKILLIASLGGFTIPFNLFSGQVKVP